MHKFALRAMLNGRRGILGSLRSSFRPSGLDSPRGATCAYSVAVVGAGPSGFYTAKYLTEGPLSNVVSKVDILEKLPVPYGLVRFGVAPDHEQTKSVMATFDEVAGRPGVRFLGNVSVGCAWGGEGDVTVENLLKAYDAVVLAHGAASDRTLGCEGEDLEGVVSARDVVNWYNGHPDYVDFARQLRLEDVTDVVVVGQGNVAIDCARVLVKGTQPSGGEALLPTDIADHARESIANSTIRRITLAARRSHVQAACTIKELREVSRLPWSRLVTDASEMSMGDTEANREEALAARPRRRLTELIERLPRIDAMGEQWGEGELKEEAQARGAGPDDVVETEICLRYLVQPLRMVADATGKRVQSVRFGRSLMFGSAGEQRVELDARGGGRALCAHDSVESDENVLDIPAQLVVTSVGYQCVGLPGVPFCSKRAVVPSEAGRVVNPADDGPGDKIQPGLYVAGWLKRGPTGIIGTNIPDAKETAMSVLADLVSLRDSQQMVTPKEGLAFPAAISWEDYLRIQAAEERAGRASNPPRPRVKFVSLAEMLDVAKK